MWGSKEERCDYLRSQAILPKDIARVKKRIQIGDKVSLFETADPVQGRFRGRKVTGTVVGKYPHLFVMQVGEEYTSFRWAELAASRKRR